MYRIKPTGDMTANELYEYLKELIADQLSAEDDTVANLANISAMIYACLDRLNWAGFYLMKGGELVLGPFQGLPACNRIGLGRGVCGSSVQKKETVLVRDVSEFPGHIACDESSASELVIPMVVGDEVVGVLDLDSPEPGRFTEEDKLRLEEIMNAVSEHLFG